MTALQVIDDFAGLDVAVEVQVDRKLMTLRQILELASGSVIKLPRSAGENMDVFLGGAHVCHGEVVIIEDTVGVRITDFREEE